MSHSLPQQMELPFVAVMYVNVMFNVSVLACPIAARRNVPFFPYSSPSLYFPLPSFKFSPDVSLKSGFSVLNQTYGMLL